MHSLFPFLIWTTASLSYLSEKKGETLPWTKGPMYAPWHLIPFGNSVA